MHYHARITGLLETLDLTLHINYTIYEGGCWISSQPSASKKVRSKLKIVMSTWYHMADYYPIRTWPTRAHHPTQFFTRHEPVTVGRLVTYSVVPHPNLTFDHPNCLKNISKSQISTNPTIGTTMTNYWLQMNMSNILGQGIRLSNKSKGIVY